MNRHSSNLAFFGVDDKYYNEYSEGNANVMENIITHIGRKLLNDRIAELASQKPALTEDIANARENGGTEENEELEMALDAVERVNHEITKYENILSTYRLVDIPEPGEYEKVVFGVKVKLLNLNANTEHTYQLLGEFESDPKNGIISVNSPLGKELMHLYEGDVAEIERGNNEYIEYEILRIFVD